MIQEYLNKQQVILASGSPRRKQLLSQAEVAFKVIKPNIDETHPKDFPAKDIPEYLACKKNQKLLREHPERIIISADTVVLHQDAILEKPSTATEAFDMLVAMRRNSHQVMTGVAFSMEGKVHSFSEVTRVTFSNISDQQIQHYVNKYKPFDKAGAYGIQEWVGLVGIEKIEGCYYNVMGLPVNRLFREMGKVCPK